MQDILEKANDVMFEATKANKGSGGVGKKFRYDYREDGKLDVTFIRTSKKWKELNDKSVNTQMGHYFHQFGGFTNKKKTYFLWTDVNAGNHGGDAGEQALFAGVAGVDGAVTGYNAFSPVATITSVSGTANGSIDEGEEFFQWRVALTSPFIYDGIRNPNVQIAFSTEEAVGALSTSAEGGDDCLMFGAAPDVLITIN
jgi:hypothetical protein